MVYPKIPGRPLASVRRLGRRARKQLTDFLAQLLTDLAACGTRRGQDLGLWRGTPRAIAGKYVRLRERYRRTARRHLDEDLRQAVDAALEAMRSTLHRSHYRPVLTHNDLWPNHLVWDPFRDRPVGVIDWEDAQIGDPATDLVTFGELDPDLMARLVDLRRRRGDREFDERLRLYRRIVPIHGLLYGLEIGNPKLANAHRRQLRTNLLGN
jgi:aminoglycoside phosphotransferase (APT) family kinase protein